MLSLDLFDRPPVQHNRPPVHAKQQNAKQKSPAGCVLEIFAPENARRYMDKKNLLNHLFYNMARAIFGKL